MKDRAKDTVTAAAGEIRQLGDFIREQRREGGISLRQLSKLAGVSNPYLSQIERGMRKPSAEILQQIAKGLRISAEALYVQAGFLEERAGSTAVIDAVLADEALNERQKQVLLEIYASFRQAGAATPAEGDVVVSVVTATGDVEPAVSTPTTPPAPPHGKRPAPDAARDGVPADPTS